MRNFWRANARFITFLLCFGFFRLAIADWNPIPSGSMRPSLLEGDVVLVNRVAYDLKLPLTGRILFTIAEPARGDIVTFSSPQEGTRLIKRLVAVPGDVVAMRAGVLMINGARADYAFTVDVPDPTSDASRRLSATEQVLGHERAVQYRNGATALRDFGPVRVPDGHYFMLGDNRDNSADSRVIGFVPRALLIGRAHHLLLSVDIHGRWLPRWSRFGQALV